MARRYRRRRARRRAAIRHHGGVRRIVPLLLTGLLVLAACGPEREPPEDRSAPTTTTAAVAADTPAPATTTDPNDGPDADADAATPAPTTTRPRGGGAASAPMPEDPTAPPPGSGDVEPTPADDGRLGPPGAYARTLLRPQPATTIVVERFHQRDAAPSRAAFAFAENTLRSVTAKPVSVRPSVELSGGARSWTADELRQTANAVGRVTAGSTTAVLRLLFVHGTFEGQDSVLGVAVRGDVIAIFSDAIDGARTPVLAGDTIEEAVIVHELGHVLGLVDLARDTGRADPEHPGHSRSSRSVMYWAVESSLIGQVLTGPPPREFDAQDRADLEALRQGA
jgi:hypothetical protein